MTMTITTSALRKRVSRKLSHDGERLSYGPNPWTTGKCWRVISASNVITSAHDDLEDLARQLGVLPPTERLAA